MFHVKICGVCHQGDLPAIAAAGADAVGLNFYPNSKRFLSEREADEVAAAVPRELARVGVFVNATGAAMLAAAQRFQLDYLQLHGDEPPEQLAELRAWPVIKAFRFGTEGWQPIESYLSACKQHGALPVAGTRRCTGGERRIRRHGPNRGLDCVVRLALAHRFAVNPGRRAHDG